MQLKKITKKQARQVKRMKLFILFLILFFAGVSTFLLYKALTFEKRSVISPVSKTGFYKNSDIENRLRKANIEYKNLKHDKDAYQFDIADQGYVVISTKKDISAQISSLQLILRSLKIEGKRFKSLDFRYDKPVIKLI